jgi:general secretion pathway protein I
MRPERGFTLVEVLVALAIVALSLAAIAASMSQMLDAANSLRDRTYASWIGQNKIAEMRLANVLPEVNSTSGEVDFADATWDWRAVVSETGIENFMRIDVSVSHAGDEYVVLTVTGFVGAPASGGQPGGAAGDRWREIPDEEPIQ